MELRTPALQVDSLLSETPSVLHSFSIPIWDWDGVYIGDSFKQNLNGKKRWKELIFWAPTSGSALKFSFHQHNEKSQEEMLLNFYKLASISTCNANLLTPSFGEGKWKCKSLSPCWLFADCTHGLYGPWNSLGQNTGVNSCSLLQGIFPTRGSNPGLPHCRLILY